MSQRSVTVLALASSLVLAAPSAHARSFSSVGEGNVQPAQAQMPSWAMEKGSAAAQAKAKAVRGKRPSKTALRAQRRLARAKARAARREAARARKLANARLAAAKAPAKVEPTPAAVELTQPMVEPAQPVVAPKLTRKQRMAERRAARKQRIAEQRAARKQRIADRRKALAQAKRDARLRKRARRRRRAFVQLSDGPGLTVRTPERAWGSLLTVNRLQEITTAYAQAFPQAPPIWIHDISKHRGGRMAPHLSHRSGRDVDIRVMKKRPTKKYTPASPRTMHVARAWFLLKALVDTCDVELVLLDRRLQRVLYRYAKKQGVPKDELDLIFQYPQRRHSQWLAPGIVRHWKGHADHFHVRFRSPGKKELVGSARDYCELKNKDPLTLALAGPSSTSVHLAP